MSEKQDESPTAMLLLHCHQLPVSTKAREHDMAAHFSSSAMKSQALTHGDMSQALIHKECSMRLNAFARQLLH